MLRIATSPIRRAGERKFDGEVLFSLQNKNRQHRGKEEKAVLPVCMVNS